MTARYVLGLNQYTHSASACLVDEAGELVFALAKERVTRKKHDGGDNAEVIEAVLRGAGVQSDQIALCVANNHLFRIPPFEKTLPWAVAMNQHPSTYTSPSNLLPGVRKHELSHHLAHAWSVLAHAPFDRGLIVVADGIGSTYADVHRLSSESALGDYTSDADLPHHPDFRRWPQDMDQQLNEENATFREAESVYLFDGGQMQSLWKRWIRELSPVFLYNYGFENQESLGAVYSRVSSHVFGDWNACGKIMGMAPWAGRWQVGEQGLQAESSFAAMDTGSGSDSHFASSSSILTGPLEQLQVDWDRLRNEAAPNQWEDRNNRPAYAQLSADVQHDLEEVMLEFLKRLREQTGERNLCLVGGVALNSTMNGRIAREAGFDQVYLPPWPGDDGIAVGCAQFGRALLAENSTSNPSQPSAPTTKPRVTPYLGGSAPTDDIEDALHAASAWIDVGPGNVDAAADAIAAGKVIGWFQGRSEFGPRALGNRSILATPADADMVERINAMIKKRESFRPFAPTVLAEHAADWFENVTPSPYMSLTVQTHEHQRQRIPAVVHVDGTARIQTLERDHNPLYHDLVSAFHQRSGLPMVLNTSFNIKGEPIVETADDAVRHFLDSDLDLLFLGEHCIQKRPFPSDDELAELRPVAHAGFTAQMLSNAEGEAMQVNLMAHGQNWEADQLELGVLEACTGESTIADLLIDFEAEFEVDPADVLRCLKAGFQRRLLHFEA
jgi:carbamoyltransferase